MSNNARTLYTGVTSDLPRRVLQHKAGQMKGFTSQYHLTSLVYYEETSEVLATIGREKQIKGWLRKKKIALIESMNPYWFDLSDAVIGTASMVESGPSLRSGRQ